MRTRARFAGASRAVLVLGLLALAGLSMPGCGSSYDGGGGGTPSGDQTYSGVVSASGESGVFDLTIHTGGQPYPATTGGLLPAVVNVSGNLRIVGGASLVLTGTYDTTTRHLQVDDSMAVSLDGTVSSDGVQITGTYTSPSGSGRFVAFSSGTQTVVYCGTFTGLSGGVWNLVRRGSALLGAFSSNGGSSGLLNGSVDMDGTVSLTIESTGSATGAMTATSASGTWTVGTDSGTWSGSTSACGG